MGSAFKATCAVERKSRAILLPYLKELSDGALVLTDKGPLAKWLQESVGDVFINYDKRFYAIELKAEEKHTGNVFLEIWSNRNLESRESHAERGQNPGWMVKIKSDLLLYHFLDKNVLYSFDVFELKRYLFGQGESVGEWGRGFLRERLQRKYDQLNDAWGVVVPVQLLYNKMPRGTVKKTSMQQRELPE